MKLLRRQIALAVTGLFLTGYTVMAADTPAAAAPAAIQPQNEIVQTVNVPSLTKQKKTTPAKKSRPLQIPVSEAVAGTSVPVTGFISKDSGRTVTVTAGNRPATLFISSSIPGSANTAYADFTKKAYVSYHEQMNFFVLQTGRTSKIENWLKEEAFPFPVLTGDYHLYTNSLPRLILIDKNGVLRYRLNKDLPDKDVRDAFQDTITAPVPPDAAQRQKRLDTIIKERHTRDRELRLNDAFSPLSSQLLFLSILYQKEYNQSFPESAWQDLSLAGLSWYYGDDAETESHLEQMTAHAPNSPLPYGIRSLYDMMDGNPGAGYADTLQGLRKNPDDILLNSLAIVYEYMMGQKDKAAHRMQTLVEAHPEWNKDRTLSYTISRNYITMNQKDLGLAFYRKYLEHDKNPARGHLDYARLLTKSGNYEEALKECRISRNKLSEEEKNTYYPFVGSTYQQEAWIQWKLGNAVQALSCATKSINLLNMHKYPVPQSWYILRAAIEQSLGRTTAAAADWEASKRLTSLPHLIPH